MYTPPSLGGSVVDLGATPGGWSQVAVPLVGKRGRVVAVDLLDMAPIAGVTFMIGDFTQPSVQARLLTALEAGGADIILSDMAPAFLGDRETDHLRSIGLSMQVQSSPWHYGLLASARMRERVLNHMMTNGGLLCRSSTLPMST